MARHGSLRAARWNHSYETTTGRHEDVRGRRAGRRGMEAPAMSAVNIDATYPICGHVRTITTNSHKRAEHTKRMIQTSRVPCPMCWRTWYDELTAAERNGTRPDWNTPRTAEDDVYGPDAIEYTMVRETLKSEIEWERRFVVGTDGELAMIVTDRRWRESLGCPPFNPSRKPLERWARTMRIAALEIIDTEVQG